MGNVINISNAFSRNSLNGFISDSNKTLSPYKEKYLCSKTPKNNAEIYNCLYDYLNDSYRIEYFYKNTIFNKIILGKYSLNTASAITELPLSNSIADLVVFGKEAVVYEIKTDYDNLSKLKHQILDYYKVFAKVYVVTGRQFVEKAKKFIENSNLPVGLKVVNNNTSISTVIKADNCFSFLDKRSIFGVLRKSEYESILVKYYNKLPRTNDFNHYNTCYNWFKKIPDRWLYDEYIEILGLRNFISNELIDSFLSVPYCLRFLVYFMGFKKHDYDRMDLFLRST